MGEDKATKPGFRSPAHQYIRW